MRAPVPSFPETIYFVTNRFNCLIYKPCVIACFINGSIIIRDALRGRFANVWSTNDAPPIFHRFSQVETTVFASHQKRRDRKSSVNEFPRRSSRFVWKVPPATAPFLQPPLADQRSRSVKMKLLRKNRDKLITRGLTCTDGEKAELSFAKTSTLPLDARTVNGRARYTLFISYSTQINRHLVNTLGLPLQWEVDVRRCCSCTKKHWPARLSPWRKQAEAECCRLFELIIYDTVIVTQVTKACIIPAFT